MVAHTVPPKERQAGHPLARTWARPKYNVVDKIMSRFDMNPSEFARLMGVARSTVYHWMSGPPRGTNGLFPPDRVDQVNALARHYGILLTESDWAPEIYDYDSDE